MFRVRCPMCKGELAIDPRTQRVVSHRTEADMARKPAEQLESLLDKVQKDKAGQDSRLDAAKERESRRQSHVEELFKKAREKAAENPDDDRPAGPVW